MEKPPLDFSIVKLWSREGIPYQEIVARVSERSEEECGFAVAIVESQCPEKWELIRWHICELVEQFEDTKKILDHMREKREKVVAEHVPGKDEHAFFEEVNALMIEWFVRKWREWKALGMPGVPKDSQ